MTGALCSVLYIPCVHGTRLSESHRKLRATLHFDHPEAGERVDLKTRNQYINLRIDFGLLTYTTTS